LNSAAGGIEGPGTPSLGETQARLVGAAEHLLRQLAVRGLEIDGERVGADQIDGDDAGDAVGGEAQDLGVFFDVLKRKQRYFPLSPGVASCCVL